MSHPRYLTIEMIRESLNGQLTYGEVRRLIDALDIQPALELNTIPYYSEATLARLRRAMLSRAARVSPRAHIVA